MLRSLACAALLLIAVAPALADDATRQAKMAEYLRTVKIRDMFEDQFERTRERYFDYGRQISARFEAGLGDQASAETRAAIEAAVKRYNERIAAQFDTDDLLARWKKGFGDNLSDADLDALTAFFKSPLGQRGVEANRSANAAFLESYDAQVEAEVNEIVRNLAADLKAASAK